MSRPLFHVVIALAAVLSCSMPVFAENQAKDEVEAFSDTTSVPDVQSVVDSTVIQVNGSRYIVTHVDSNHVNVKMNIADFDDLKLFEGIPRLFGLFTAGTGIVMLLIFGFFVVLPLLLVLLLLWLLVRNNRRRKATMQAKGQKNGQQNDNPNKDSRFIEMEEQKKLYRSDDRIIGGVCAGFAEYCGIDTTLVRFLYALLTIFTSFAGVIVYIIALIVIPQRKSLM